MLSPRCTMVKRNPMRIRYNNGRTLEGMILSLTADTARVTLKDRPQIAEFRLVGGQWISEERESVVFEFPYAPVLQALLWSETPTTWTGSRLLN